MIVFLVLYLSSRYCKRIEKSDAYINTCLSLATTVEGLVKQNNALEIYSEYFLEEDPTTAEPEVYAK